MFKRLFTAAILFGAASTAPPALEAQTFCAPRAGLVAQLETKYSEELSAFGFQSGSQVMEVWSSSETGSWTLLVTRADGTSCVVASGMHWTPQYQTQTSQDSGS